MSINKSNKQFRFINYQILQLLSILKYATAQNNNSPPSPSNPYGLPANFNPSMAIIIIVLISAFFFMGFFSIYIRQCAGERQTGGTVRTATGNAGRSRRAARGLEPSVIEKFPTFMYSVVKGLKIGKGALECAVCLNEFEDDETLRLLPKCDHVFHPECIDAWLASHTTCPVCRANLTPDSNHPEADGNEVTEAQNQDSESDSDIENQSHHSITILDNQTRENSSAPEVINPLQIPFQNRPGRSGSRRPQISGKFPRSHSTGHSLIQPGENMERFTLRLPEDIRKKIVNGKLNRTTSLVSFPARYGTGGSSRRGYRGGSIGEGSSRGKYNRFWRLDSKAKSDRWVFSMAPPFISRGGSVRRDDGEGSVKEGNGKSFLTSVKSVKSPFDCLAVKVDGEMSSSSRPPV
ncbi:hypothetical protein IFM89_025053 [Coptis chinensis]|uniref:RING-type E3 ubiquitin transferase n=1 Tax=Coptis chinensis TaxID=261450 RepID=A0A835I6Z5_9MAGN|nr:hypothetical protein IFM89_025053 [Coptis chinensis]